MSHLNGKSSFQVLVLLIYRLIQSSDARAAKSRYTSEPYYGTNYHQGMRKHHGVLASSVVHCIGPLHILGTRTELWDKKNNRLSHLPCN